MPEKKKKDPIVCYCLNVTESDLIRAIKAHEIRSVDDVRNHTLAGDGCTACHPALEKLLKDVIEEQMND